MTDELDAKSKSTDIELAGMIRGIKGARLRIMRTTFRGREMIDCRLFWSDAEGNLRPTQKGLCLFREEFKAFAGIVEAVEAMLEAETNDHL